MSKIIFVKNNKGGVGKSTISKNIASGLAMSESKVALVSFDAQNDSLALMGFEFIDEKNGLKAFVKNNKKDIKINVRESLDYYPLETDIFSKALKVKIIYINLK